MAVTFFIVLIDALLILGLLWISANSLYQQKQAIVSAMDARRLGRGVRVLIIIPLIVVLAAIILSALQNEFFVPFTHAIILLGLWMAVILLIFSYLLLSRLKNWLQLAAMLGFLCAIIPILYFSPTDGFQGIFGQVGQVGYVLPLIEGVAMIGISYTILLRLDRALR